MIPEMKMTKCIKADKDKLVMFLNAFVNIQSGYIG